MNVVFYSSILPLTLFSFWGFLSICKNRYKRYMKEQNGRMQLAEIKKWDAIYLIQPTLYEITVEYVEGGETKERLIKTISSFAKKYKKENVIQIVTVQGTDFLFAKEENWKAENRNGYSKMGIALVFGIEMLGFAEGLSVAMMYFACFLYFALLSLGVWIGNKQQTCDWHRTRMKYVTKLSCEEVLKRFRQGMGGKFLMQKEKEDGKDVCYVLSVNSKTSVFSGGVHEKVRYRVVVTLAQEGSAVWIYLSECRNPYALNHYAKRLKRYLEKTIEAVRVE